MVQSSFKSKRMLSISLRGVPYKQWSGGILAEMLGDNCTAKNRLDSLYTLSHGAPGSLFSLMMSHILVSNSGEATLWGMESHTHLGTNVPHLPVPDGVDQSQRSPPDGREK